MIKSYLSLGLGIATIAVAYFYAWPAWTKYQLLREDAKHFSEMQQEFNALTKGYDDFIASPNEISSDDLARIDQALRTAPPKKEVLVQLEYLVAKYGLGLNDIKLEQSANAAASAASAPSGANPPQPRSLGAMALLSGQGELKEFPVSLTVAGPYTAFKSFLLGIQKNLPLFDVDTITFSSQKDKGAYSFTLGMHTYYQ